MEHDTDKVDEAALVLLCLTINFAALWSFFAYKG